MRKTGDDVATYPFVRSAVDLGRASGPRLAVVWHMAEGGGTVGFLSRQNPNGVSVHFVVEYSGRVVQMLALDHLHTSLRVSAIRNSDDPPFDWQGETITYGAAAAQTVLGDWQRNPNNASIGVEIEGFARDGPNATQRTAIGKLWLDMASRHPGIRSLGHRDFADYKACPGKRFPWDVTGGHGSASEVDVKFIQASGLIDWPSDTLLRLPAGTPLYGFDGSEVTKTGSARDWSYVGLVDARGGQFVISAGTGRVYDDGVTRPTLLVARTGTLVPAPDPVSVKYPVTVGGKSVGEVELP